SVRRSTVMRPRATDGMSASECQGKRPDQAVKHRSDEMLGVIHPLASELPASSENVYHPRQFWVHLGNPDESQSEETEMSLAALADDEILRTDHATLNLAPAINPHLDQVIADLHLNAGDAANVRAAVRSVAAESPIQKTPGSSALDGLVARFNQFERI